jgi:SNF2 family DNA or RNA helicase
LQNQLGELHTLLKLLCLEPWTKKLIWKQCIEIPAHLCNPRGISSLQAIMKGISMRRLKNTILDLPEKRESPVNLKIKEPWDQVYQKHHEEFSIQFGKNQISGQGWNANNFFDKLVDLQQLCNHPAIIEKIPGKNNYFWNESSKIFHLIEDLKTFLSGGSQKRAVIFSEFKRFLQM